MVCAAGGPSLWHRQYFRCAVATVVYVSTALVGAAIFYAIEGAGELESARAFQAQKQAQFDYIEQYLRQAPDPHLATNFTALVSDLQRYAESNQVAPNPDALNWTFGGSLFFALTIMTTIGYGTFAPYTPAGRAMVIVYGMFALAISGVCVAVLTSGFDAAFCWLAKQSTRLGFLSKEGKESWRYHRSIFYGAIFIIFWLACSGIFVASERDQDWSFFIAFYYSFVTFTTIGFGDYAINYSDTGRGLILFLLLTLLGLIVFAKAVTEVASMLQSTFAFLGEEVVGVVIRNDASGPVAGSKTASTNELDRVEYA